VELTWARIGHAQNTLYGSGMNSRHCDRIFRHSEASLCQGVPSVLFEGSEVPFGRCVFTSEP